jgi:zinc transport system substrate-binding protein
LRYVAAFPSSGDSEPNARQMAAMVGLIRSTSAGAVFYEELVSPRLADTLARETGTRLLMLNAAHNVSRDDLAHGVTFPALMERNLENLRQGLRCR